MPDKKQNRPDNTRTVGAPTVEELVPPLKAGRAVLRPVMPEDADAIAEKAGDWEVARHTAGIPHPYEKNAAKAWISAMRQGMAGGWCLAYSLVVDDGAEDDGKVIGNLGIHWDARHFNGTLGYWLARSHWGQGFATDAVATIVPWLFDQCGLRKLEASVNPDNTASAKVLEKNGFTVSGQREEDSPARGVKETVDVYTLTAEQFQSMRPKPSRVLLVVAAALLKDDSKKVLLARRPLGGAMSGLWEFPGGKIDTGERPEQALVRELEEELGITVLPENLEPVGFASHSYAGFHLLMPLYACDDWEGDIRPREKQEFAWVSPASLATYPMPLADVPLIAQIRAFLAAR